MLNPPHKLLINFSGHAALINCALCCCVFSSVYFIRLQLYIRKKKGTTPADGDESGARNSAANEHCMFFIFVYSFRCTMVHHLVSLGGVETVLLLFLAALHKVLRSKSARLQRIGSECNF